MATHKHLEDKFELEKNENLEKKCRLKEFREKAKWSDKVEATNWLWPYR